MGDSSGVLDPQAAVDQLFGEGKARVVEAVTSTRVTETEVILINGAPVRLVGEDGASLKEALLAGRLPDRGLLTRVLASVLGGDVKGVTKVESEVSVTSKVTSRDTLSVVRGGRVVDERTREWRSDSESVGKSCETFSPPSSSAFAFSSSASSSSTSSSPPPPPPPLFRPSSPFSRTTPSPSPNNPSGGGSPSFPRGRSKDSALGKSNSSSSSSSTSSSSVSAKDLTLDLNNEKKSTKTPIFTGAAAAATASSSREDSLLATPLRREPCLSPELEESLARTSIKDPAGIRKKDLERLGSASSSFKPTIFGTVADDLSPRDNTKRGFPQSSKGTKGGLDLEGSGHPLPEWALADDDNSLVYEEGVLVSGCLGALVLHATPTPTYYPDAAYLFAFLLSARLFIKPHELLQKICSLGFAQQGLVNDDINTINKDELGNFVPHMVQLLGEWSETFPYDFRDERMMVGVRTLTHRCIALQPSLRRDVTQVLHNLLNKLTQLERYEESLAKLTVPPPADFLPSVPDITEACPSALVLAQQLTHIELERLCYIGPEEFVQAFAKDNLESTYKDLKKTNNLESYVQWFNRLSYLVATQACFPVKKKQRIRVIEMWIEVARECFNIGNFNSLMGVIAGLNMSPVARLKKTWSKVQTAKFSVLEHQMDPSSNFSSYRSTLKAAMWRSAGAVDERQKIVIPFFSLLVKDLYFLNEGCANRLPNGHINFDKFWQLAKQVTEFMAWKQVNCPFEKDSQILHYLQTTPVLSETGLALASFEGEGPENSYEKERFKALKAELQQHSIQQQHGHSQQSS